MRRTFYSPPILIIGYFALHAAIRVWAGAPLVVDEGELMVSTQALAWGYGPQPPLYTWIQIAAFGLLGTGIPAIALVKQSCLAALYLGTWQAARALAPGRGVAEVAVLSLFLLPFVALTMPLYLTHSVLMGALVSWATWSFLRLLTRGAWRDYLMFGLFSALGVLAKLNALPLLAALLLAGALTREARPRIFSPRMLAALLLAAVVLALPSWWMATHLDLTLGRFSKLHPSTGLAGLVIGPAQLLLDTGSAVWLLVLAHGLIFWWRRAPAGEPAAAVEPWLRRVVTLAFALTFLQLVGVVAVGRATTFLTRWMLPVLCLAPLVAAAWAAPRLTRRRLRFLAAVALLPAGLALLRASIYLGIGPSAAPAGLMATSQVRQSPSRAVAAWLPPAGALLARDLTLAGNLRLYRPELQVATPEYAALGLAYRRPVVLVWQGAAGATLPEDLARLHRRLFGTAPDGPISRFEAPYSGRPGRTLVVYRMDVE